TLAIDDPAEHVSNGSESTSVGFTVAGLDDGGTGTVTFSDGVNHVDVAVTGAGTYSADLSSLTDGQITSSLSFTDAEGNSAAAAGNAVALDTDRAELTTRAIDDTADHVINVAEATTVSYTVDGLESGDTATVTFSDGTPAHDIVVTGLANGTYTVDLSTLTDGTITSSLTSTDTVGNTLTASGNAVAL